MGFARVLKDNAGKLSGYRECDGEVAYMPKQESHENIFRKVKIDVDTTEGCFAPWHHTGGLSCL